MKLYLSSYLLGNEASHLAGLAPFGRIGYINNAQDFSTSDIEKKNERKAREMGQLSDLGLTVEHVDLAVYFHEPEKLARKLDELGAVFLCGGNVFVLRQAMKLSGMDTYLQDLPDSSDFLYAGYSAGPCVLGPTLKVYAIVDDASDTPYKGLNEVIWDGLGLLDFNFMPHWDSDHPESTAIDREIEACKKAHLPYRAIRDGDVIILE